MNDPAFRSGAKPAFMLILTVLVPFGVGYYMSYLFRTVNAIISPQLVSDVGLTAADLGLMTSVYFITFAATQLPLGIVLDRFGPRRVQACLMMVAALGAAMFALGDDIGTLLVGRALVGIGVSACLMAAIKANVEWFPGHRLPLVNGIIFAFGTFGALSTTVPLELLVRTVDWRTVFWCLAGLSVVSGLAIAVVVPERSAGSPVKRRSGEGIGWAAELKPIYGSLYFWRLSILVCLHNGVFLSYQALWAAPWLRDVAGQSRSAVAESMFLFNVGMFAGVLSIGLLAGRLQKSGIPVVVPLTVGVILSIAVQSVFAAGGTAFPAILCLLFGYFGSWSTLGYAALNQHFPTALTGRVNTAHNMLTFVSAFAIQWFVGIIIGLFPAPGPGLYNADGHQTALLILIALEIAGFAFFLWPRRRGDGLP